VSIFTSVVFVFVGVDGKFSSSRGPVLDNASYTWTSQKLTAKEATHDPVSFSHQVSLFAISPVDSWGKALSITKPRGADATHGIARRSVAQTAG
jgi:hypothetical protein